MAQKAGSFLYFWTGINQHHDGPLFDPLPWSDGHPPAPVATPHHRHAMGGVSLFESLGKASTIMLWVGGQ